MWSTLAPIDTGIYRYRDTGLNRNTVETIAEVYQLPDHAALLVRMTNGWHGALIGFTGEWSGPFYEETMPCSAWDSRCVQLEQQLKEAQAENAKLHKRLSEIREKWLRVADYVMSEYGVELPS